MTTKSFNEIVAKLAAIRQHKRVVLTSGVFDMFHVGHLQFLERASQFGDVLVVHVDGDQRTRLRKGEARPVIPVAERLQIVASLSVVDYALTSELSILEPEMLQLIRPHVLVKTKRPEHRQTDRLRQISECNQILPGVIVKYLEPCGGVSTSNTIRTILEPFVLISDSLPSDWRQLHILAVRSAAHGYSYSGMRVGASVRANNGKIYSGANIGNASPALALCAERVAIMKAISDGARFIDRLVLYSNGDSLITPCGHCLQTIYEFSSAASPTQIHVLHARHVYASTISRLLPAAFVNPRKRQPRNEDCMNYQ